MQKPISKKLTFPGSQNESIAASLELPLGEIKAYALFAHCFACSKDMIAESRISRALTDYGIAVLRFDFTGLGKSEGEFTETNFSSNVGDLLKAADFLRENYQAPKIIIGQSLGGTAVLAASKDIPEAIAVATIGAPSDPAHVAKQFEEVISEIESKGQALTKLGGQPFCITKQFLDDIHDQDLLKSIAELRKALLILHSPLDEIVSIDNAREIYDAAHHPKSFVSLDKANHMLTNKADAIYVAKVLAAWASHYVETDGVEPHTAAEEPGTVVVSETPRGKYSNYVYADKHVLMADEPVAYDGNDAGPSPYRFLLASLGSCTSITVRMYADLKNIPLDKITVTLKHEKIHAEDCRDCETKEGKVDKITRNITFEGDLTEEQRNKLFEIANKCPVHRTLSSEIVIESNLT